MRANAIDVPFSTALESLEAGFNVSRASWPDGDFAAMLDGELWIFRGPRGNEKWTASSAEDRTAEDWIIHNVEFDEGDML